MLSHEEVARTVSIMCSLLNLMVFRPSVHLSPCLPIYFAWLKTVLHNQSERSGLAKEDVMHKRVNWGEFMRLNKRIILYIPLFPPVLSTLPDPQAIDRVSIWITGISETRPPRLLLSSFRASSTLIQRRQLRPFRLPPNRISITSSAGWRRRSTSISPSTHRSTTRDSGPARLGSGLVLPRKLSPTFSQPFHIHYEHSRTLRAAIQRNLA